MFTLHVLGSPIAQKTADYEAAKTKTLSPYLAQASGTIDKVCCIVAINLPNNHSICFILELILLSLADFDRLHERVIEDTNRRQSYKGTEHCDAHCCLFLI